MTKEKVEETTKPKMEFAVRKGQRGYRWVCKDEENATHCILAVGLGRRVDNDGIERELYQLGLTADYATSIRRFDCGYAEKEDFEVIKQIGNKLNLKVITVEESDLD